MYQEVDLDLMLSVREQEIIMRAAKLANAGRYAEAEVVRFAAGYHNLKEDTHP